jgi:hypothetical protein
MRGTVGGVPSAANLFFFKEGDGGHGGSGLDSVRWREEKFQPGDSLSPGRNTGGP